MINGLLPDGCPFVIGGGIVRDGILGGRPSDIDVWLPSNITIPDQEEFRQYIVERYPEASSITCIFSGPGAHVGPGRAEGGVLAAPGDEAYGDVNNHWVFDMQFENLPQVNFMRSMTPWNNNPQDFFDGLMRAFDIDQCMYFIGYMPGQESVGTVIMPTHLADRYVGAERSPWTPNHIEPRTFAALTLNEVYWNQYRMNQTSANRIDARLRKMIDKYHFFQRSVSDMSRLGLIIPTEQIVATAIPLSLVMKVVNRTSAHPHKLLPHPSTQNRMNLQPSVNNMYTQMVNADLAMLQATVLANPPIGFNQVALPRWVIGADGHLVEAPQ